MDRPAPMPDRPPLRRWPWLLALAAIGAVLVASGVWFAAREDDARDARAAALVLENELSATRDFGTVLQGKVAEEDVPGLLPFVQARVGRAREQARVLVAVSGGDADVRALADALARAERAMRAYARDRSTLAGMAIWLHLDRIATLAPTVVAAQEDRSSALAWQARAGQLVLFAAALVLVLVLLSSARRALLARADEHAAHLRDLALHDALTGLPNRRSFEQDAATTAGPATVVLCDLDGFKRYNDRHGHAAGDALLVRAGEALAEAVGARGRVYRLGGDELCALVDAPDPALGRQLERAIADRLGASGVTGSAGTALVPAEAADVTAGLRLADERMYAAKALRHAAEPPDGSLRTSTSSSPSAAIRSSSACSSAWSVSGP